MMKKRALAAFQASEEDGAPKIKTLGFGSEPTTPAASPAPAAAPPPAKPSGSFRIPKVRRTTTNAPAAAAAPGTPNGGAQHEVTPSLSRAPSVQHVPSAPSLQPVQSPSRRPPRRLAPPAGWFECAPHGHLLHQMLPCKVPLGAAFAVDGERAWSPHMLSQAAGGRIRALVHLADSDMVFFEPSEMPAAVAYHRIHVEPPGVVPKEAAIDEFIAIADSVSASGDSVVAVCCTTGVNLTGFAIASYLIIRHRLSARQAVAEFTTSRFPGMFRQDFVDALFRRYGGPRPDPAAAVPSWARGGLDVAEVGWHGARGPPGPSWPARPPRYGPMQ